MTPEQESKLIELLWEYMHVDPKHDDRVFTGWGTKTKEGLIASIESILPKSQPSWNFSCDIHNDHSSQASADRCRELRVVAARMGGTRR